MFEKCDNNYVNIGGALSKLLILRERGDFGGAYRARHSKRGSSRAEAASLSPLTNGDMTSTWRQKSQKMPPSFPPPVIFAPFIQIHLTNPIIQGRPFEMTDQTQL